MEFQINSVLPDLSLNKINFSVGTDNSPEGIYTHNSMYHYVITPLYNFSIKKCHTELSDV